MPLTETAYAKINLALHVRRRREDGYHELETLFAFVDVGDRLSAKPAEQDRVTTLGEFAGGIDNPFDNLVAKALSALPHKQGLDITLEKNLPVAAGLGGGSGPTPDRLSPPDRARRPQRSHRPRARIMPCDQGCARRT